MLEYDGPGGVLAKGGKGFVMFDKADRWSTNPNITTDPNDTKNKKDWYRGLLPEINLFHTALHEFGHALGLEHSADKNSVMVL